MGFIHPVAVGALLMSASTGVVALNAQVLRRLDLSAKVSVAAAVGIAGLKAPASLVHSR